VEHRAILRPTYKRVPNCLSCEEFFTYLGSDGCGAARVSAQLQTGCGISAIEDFDERRV